GIRKPGSVGLPMPDVDCKIVDIETGTREVEAGEPGELCLRGPNLMDGYWKRPDETAAVLRDGWLYTGDIVRMDEDGYFSVVDRKKEMIIVSGFKVYPREVDDTEVAVLVHADDVAGVEPAVAQHGGGLLRPLPIAVHEV